MNKELQGLSFWKRLKRRNIHADGNSGAKILASTFPRSECKSLRDLRYGSRNLVLTVVHGSLQLTKLDQKNAPPGQLMPASQSQG